MDLKLLNEELVKKNILHEIIYFEEIDSTNSYAKKNNVSDDSIVLTSNQISGHGRFNRKWESTPGKDLTFTIVKSFNLNVDEVHCVNFYSSYIVYSTLCDFFRNSGSLKFTLKWPNDILLNRKKIGGILLDVQHLNEPVKKFIIGIGINVNRINLSESIIYKASSLLLESGIQICVEELLTLMLKNYYSKLDLIYRQKELMTKWKEGIDLLGRKIRFRLYEDEEKEIEAIANDIDSDGGIMLSMPDGKKKKYFSGEVRIEY